MMNYIADPGDQLIAAQQSFVIQPGPTDGKDTCYGTSYLTNVTPTAEMLNIGGWGDFYYDFFEFNLFGSPSATDTISAKLYLYGSAPVDGHDPGLAIYRITNFWTEVGVNLSNNPASVYYKNFGLFAVGTDLWNSVDITDLYKDWKNNVYPNYGIKLVPTSNLHSNGHIASSNNIDSSIRPKIIITVTPSVFPPSTPVDFTINATSSSIINLSWSAPTGRVAGYKVYKNGNLLKTVTTTSTSDVGLNPSTNYCYYITAYNSVGESAQTNQLCTTTHSQPSSNTSLLSTWDRIAVDGDYRNNLAVQITFINLSIAGTGNCSWKTPNSVVSSGIFIYSSDLSNNKNLTSVISGLEGTVTITWITDDRIIISWDSGNSTWVRY
jgi:hypothetical protein